LKAQYSYKQIPDIGSGERPKRVSDESTYTADNWRLIIREIEEEIELLREKIRKKEARMR
jgi:hypothetical protein